LGNEDAQEQVLGMAHEDSFVISPASFPPIPTVAMSGEYASIKRDWGILPGMNSLNASSSNTFFCKEVKLQSASDKRPFCPLYEAEEVISLFLAPEHATLRVGIERSAPSRNGYDRVL
jgi:hypothetical protein